MDGLIKIAVAQTDVAEGSVERTLAGIEAVLAAVGDVDVVVLPEMFATGFDVGDASIGEPAEGPVLQWMMRMAARLDAAVEGSVAVAGGDGRLVNRHYFVRPDQSFDFYDKRHLFGFGGETRSYKAGSERVVVDWRGARLLLQTCYDLRFPVFARNRGDYDVAVYVASWPQSRISAWDALLPARAIENAAYVVGVNRVGEASGVAYDGHSRIVDHLGRTVADVADGRSGVAVAEVDLKRLRSFRLKFPVLGDADAFEIL